jgi:IMP and pyridine-specific 5'-nucleotidase
MDLKLSPQRNYVIGDHKKDGLIEFIKDMLKHSFVLNVPESYGGTLLYLEGLIEEYRRNPVSSRLKSFAPTTGKFHTSLPLKDAFDVYDRKYSISKRRFVSPSFNEIRHILNLSQIMAIGTNLKMISFDGDQTLYHDGGNLENNESNSELISGIVQLLKSDVKVIVITAAGYGLDGSKYAVRVRGLLDRLQDDGLTAAQIESFFVLGGECNYLLRATAAAASTGGDTVSSNNSCTAGPVTLSPVAYEEWQAESLGGPRPHYWPAVEVAQILDTAEQSMRHTMAELGLRARCLRKERAVGVCPGGDGRLFE